MAKRDRSCPKVILRSRWRGMVSRCCNPQSDKFHNYGGRGIGVHPDFMDCETFVAWGIANGFHPSLQLDRIDNDGDYSPDNCRWATRSQNQRNKRTTVRLADGRSLADVAELAGLPRHTLRNRLRDGWSLEDATTVPYAEKRPKFRRVYVASGLDLPCPDLDRPSYDPGYPAVWLAKDKGDA